MLCGGCGTKIGWRVTGLTQNSRCAAANQKFVAGLSVLARSYASFSKRKAALTYHLSLGRHWSLSEASVSFGHDGVHVGLIPEVGQAHRRAARRRPAGCAEISPSAHGSALPNAPNGRVELPCETYLLHGAGSPTWY